MRVTRILVADDHEVVRRGIRSLLEDMPEWQVIAEACNGREAVELVEQLRPDIVIMDISMPVLNGLEATREILKRRPQTQVLVLSVHESEALIEEILAAGARGYLLKTDAGHDLVTGLEALRDHKPFFTSRVAEVVLQSFLKGQRGAAGAGPGTRLTDRERQIVQLVSEGKTNKEIASLLEISVKTVEAHRAHIMDKLQLESVSELVRYAIRNKIIES
jgi:DNA-binding NarL/FixJ family response regulator